IRHDLPKPVLSPLPQRHDGAITGWPSVFECKRWISLVGGAVGAGAPSTGPARWARQLSSAGPPSGRHGCLPLNVGLIPKVDLPHFLPIVRHACGSLTP